VSERIAELATNLARVRARIAAACQAAGRERSEITLVAVTKLFPASDVIALARLGVTDIGENRDQEAAAKAAEVAAAGVEVRWHYIGQLQRNKCRSVVQYADMVHSVDRLPLVETLAAAADRYRERPLDVLLQVNLDEEVQNAASGNEGANGASKRGGAPPSAIPELAEAVAAQPSLRLRGVMAVAPLGADPAVSFQRLAQVAQHLTAIYPTATIISAGMSGDLEAAIAHGATHLRIGSGLLGKRPSAR